MRDAACCMRATVLDRTRLPRSVESAPDLYTCKRSTTACITNLPSPASGRGAGVRALEYKSPLARERERGGGEGTRIQISPCPRAGEGTGVRALECEPSPK